MQKTYVEQEYNGMVVHPSKLEEEFSRFTNLAQTFALHQHEEKSGQPIDFFMKAYRLPDDGFPMHRLSSPIVIVQVYQGEVVITARYTTIASGVFHQEK